MQEEGVFATGSVSSTSRLFEKCYESLVRQVKAEIPFSPIVLYRYLYRAVVPGTGTLVHRIRTV